MNFRFELTFPDDPQFSCGIVLGEKQDFLDFHNKIVELLEFDKSSIDSFFILDEFGDRVKEISLMDMSFADESEKIYVMENTFIAEIVEKNRFKNFQYVFDIFNDRYLDITYLGEYKGQKLQKYPVCLGVEGEFPKQSDIEADISDDYKSKRVKKTHNDDYNFLDEFGDNCDIARSNYDSSDDDFENGNFEDIDNYLDTM